VASTPRAPDLVVADAFFARGEVERALDAYTRIAAAASRSDVVEARTKTAVCLRRLGLRDEAKALLRHRPSEAPDPGWAMEAALERFRIAFEEENTASVVERAKELLRDPSLEEAGSSLLLGLGDVAAQGIDTGEVEKAAAVDALITASVSPAHPAWFEARRREIDALLAGWRFADAAERCLPVERDGRRSPSDRLRMRLARVHALLLVKRTREARLAIPSAEATRRLPEVEGQRRSALAMVQRSLGRYAAAAQAYLEVARRVPAEYVHVRDSLARAATLYYCIGRRAEGERVVEKLRGLFGAGMLVDIAIAGCRIAEERYHDANGMLLDAAKYAERGAKVEALLDLLSGILSALAAGGGGAERLRHTLSGISYRYEYTPWHRVGRIARCLVSGDAGPALRDAIVTFHVHDTSHTPQTVLYLGGLACERLGLRGAARRVFRLCVESDATRPWPVILAMRRLRRG
jgi:tetratricopeptide (TPR) repeat protein